MSLEALETRKSVDAIPMISIKGSLSGTASSDLRMSGSLGCVVDSSTSLPHLVRNVERCGHYVDQRNTETNFQPSDHLVNDGIKHSEMVQQSDEVESPCDVANHEPVRQMLEINDIESEHTTLERRDLNMFDVAALIINQQVGTGILTTPGLVLQLTQSKSVALVLWIVGGLWSFLSVLVYIEFGSAFPFNGGELVYLDEVFRTPELLSTVLFSTFFILIPNSAGNAIAFAKHVLLAAIPNTRHTSDFNRSLIGYIAISALAVACLIHYFSRNSGLFLNLVFALYKMALLTTLFIAGFAASNKCDDCWHNTETPPTGQNSSLVGDKGGNCIAALVFVIYSYQGWENANYVGGELRIAKKSLKWGAFMAIVTTTGLYTLVTSAFAAACTSKELLGVPGYEHTSVSSGNGTESTDVSDTGIIQYFTRAAFTTLPRPIDDSSSAPAVTVMSILFALSAFGNLFTIIYTSSKVKQQIARQRILPFWKFFAAENSQFGTPHGALILHWVVTSIWVAATPNDSAGYSFVIGLFIYGQLIVNAAMGMAFFFIKEAYERENDRNRDRGLFGIIDDWQPVIIKWKSVQYLVAGIYVAFNLVVLVDAAIPTVVRHPAVWTWPVIIGGFLVLGFLYWTVIYTLTRWSSSASPLEIRLLIQGKDNEKSINDDKKLLFEAVQEGNTRILIYECHGWLKTTVDYIEEVCYQVLYWLKR